jgi:excinuclease ABC subunit C
MIQDGHADIQVLFIRNGMVLGRKDFYLPDERGSAANDLLADFLRQFYAKEMIVPDEVLLPCDVPERELLEAWLTEKRQAKVAVLVPQRGRKRELVQMATDNASQSLRQQLLSQKSRDRVLANLQDELALVNLPRRIEAFDISTIQGTDSVGSMVTFESNRADKRGYKRFRIKGVAGQDDFGMMQEVLRRRYSNPGMGGPPDLILIDGGKGQLNAALEVLSELSIEGPDIIGLAKARSGDEGEVTEFERVFLPGESDPIILPPASAGTHLIARVRDEAHRFAIEYHRMLRQKRAVHSELDDIPGIGEARKKALLRHFGSVERIRQASVDELAAVKGMARRAAEQVVGHFQNERAPAR